MKISEIIGEARELMDILIEAEGELTEEVEERLGALDLTIEGKVDNIAFLIMEELNDAEGYGDMASRFSKKKQVSLNKAEHLKNLLIYLLDSVDKKSVKGESFKAMKQFSRSVEVDSEVISEKYKTDVVSVKIDKVAIKEDLKSGEVEGARIIEKPFIKLT